MASTSEKGHAINVANLEDLISFCIGLKERYIPSNSKYLIPNLEELFKTGDNVLAKLKTGKTTFSNRTNERRVEFQDVKKLGTRFVNAFSISGANKLTIKDAQAVNRKLQGKAAKVAEKDIEQVATDENILMPTSKEVSNSQQSYDSIIDHLKKQVEIAIQEPNYNPNESDLKTTALSNKVTSLKTVNTAVINSFTDYANLLNERDECLYNPETGLVNTALEVKKYIKSIKGITKKEFDQINSINFINIKPKKKK